MSNKQIQISYYNFGDKNDYIKIKLKHSINYLILCEIHLSQYVKLRYKARTTKLKSASRSRNNNDNYV